MSARLTLESLFASKPIEPAMATLGAIVERFSADILEIIYTTFFCWESIFKLAE
jgi:hypothetical protein